MRSGQSGLKVQILVKGGRELAFGMMRPGQARVVTENVSALTCSALRSYLRVSPQYRKRNREPGFGEEQFPGRRRGAPRPPRTAPAAALGRLERKGPAGRPPELPVPGVPAGPRTRDAVAAAPPQDAGKPPSERRRRRRRWQFAARATVLRPSGDRGETWVPSSV